jgi:hypothetical protein
MLENKATEGIEKCATVPDRSPSVESVRAWVDLMKATDRLLLAGLMSRVGPDKVQDAYRKWYGDYCQARTHVAQLAERLANVGASRGDRSST